MNIIKWLMIGTFYLLPVVCLSQDISLLNSDTEFLKDKQIYGFIRGGLYAGFDHEDADKPYVSSAFSDLGLKIEMENGINFKAFADIRFRYGAEFLDPVHDFDIREAYVKVNGKRWNLTTGQTIVKWGRADFTNPTSKISPQNFIYRSPDREDMDMGNLLSVFNWYPTERFNLEAVAMPFYRSSVLIIDPIPLPENVTINPINSLLTGKEWFTYGLKADMHLQGIDWSLSWFDGYDPMPGTALTEFNLDLSGPIPVPYTELTITPYKNRVLGIDFETYAGNIGLRGEAAWSVPYKSYSIAEYVPWPEIKWVAGLEWASGIWRIIGEYSGKTILEFTPALVDPVIGTEADYAKIAELMAIPDFDLESYVREQVQSFNRLYNYQLEEYYHSAGLRIETELLYGKLTPSLFSLYNFTSRDLLVIPEIKYKPADGLTVTAGAEVYSGRSGSLYDIVNEFMTSIYFAIRVDF